MRLSEFCAPSQGSAPPAPQKTPLKPVGKWQILRELSVARRVFGLSERALGVLQALLSFHREDDLVPGKAQVVFPSNKAICERLHGMACSTMRRHLAALIDGGFLRRQDSPNGKRYAREAVAFGFDLSPLLARWVEISEAATQVRQAEAEVKALREAISLMRRDLVAALVLGEASQPGVEAWSQVSDVLVLTARALRRRLEIEALEAIRVQLAEALELARGLLASEPMASEQVVETIPNSGPESETETAEMGSSARETEQHCQRSDKEVLCSEPGAGDAPVERPLPCSFAMILAACPQIRAFGGEMREWADLVVVAGRLAPALGLTAEVWGSAQRVLGREQAAVVLAAMLERFAVIRSPGAYLRVLVRKATEGRFSVAPMLAALVKGSRHGLAA